jgi:hypothetical protein
MPPIIKYMATWPTIELEAKRYINSFKIVDIVSMHAFKMS